MKADEQNRAIAEFCGWVYAPQFNAPTAKAFQKDGRLRYDRELPDYYGDLNAISEAALQLRTKGNQFQWLDYHRKLFKTVWRISESSTDYVGGALAWDVIEASAPQRCEALLRTLGLWKESSK